jgi:putative colanic acid biosynthesis UDP-glucose lipid carrier transferase
MNRRIVSFLQFTLGGLDFITLNLVVILSSLVLKQQVPDLFSRAYLEYWASLNIAWATVFWIGNAYHEKCILSFEAFSRRSMKAYLYWAGAIIVYLFFTRALILSRVFIFVTLCATGMMLVVNRFMYLFIYQYFRNWKYHAKKVLILGYNRVSKKLESYLENEGLNTEIVGYCAEEQAVDELSHYPILSTVADAMAISKEHKVNEIFSTISPEQTPGIYGLMHEADQECIRFKLIPDLSYFINRPVHVDYYNDIPVLSLRNEPLDEMICRLKKRLFDIVISAFVILFILSWLIPLLSLIVWLDSGGPIFFSQLRSGKNNKMFYCLKFRSMHKNNDAHTRQASRHDERFTRVGKFLRRSNLDEFPQFFNVLIGDMSLVGPRPHMLRHTEEYSKLLGQYMVRQFLKPGITGWAQVNGFRGETRKVSQMAQRVEHDIWYMENWSLWLDLRIMFLTVFITFKGSKNAF